jgi:pimeloyl-ACP methyl ester carboxylesterase
VRGADFESISGALLEPASLQPWYDSYPTIDGAGDWLHVKLLISEPHEPLSDLRRTTCSFLAVYGGLDTLLPPWRGAEESGRALAAAATPDATVVVFPLGDHRIQDPSTEEFVDGYLDLLGGWTANRAKC